MLWGLTVKKSLPDSRRDWPDSALLAFEERAGLIQEDPALKGRAEQLAERMVREEWERKSGKL